MEQKRRVVVTGMGAVGPIGNDVNTLWENIKRGVCGIAPIQGFDTEQFKVKLAGEVKDLDMEPYISKKEQRTMDRYTQLALVAAKQAVSDAALNPEQVDPYRYGVMFSSGIGGIATIENENKKALERGYDRVSPYFIPKVIVNLAAGNIAIATGAKGICTCVVTACASSANAIGDAYRHIKDGYSDVIIAGGGEAAITPLGIAGFAAMKALCESTDPNRASIPFDRERSGFVMGEGAAALVLEEYTHAVNRGAHIYGEVVGYGYTCDAYHITAPSPEGEAAAKAMTLAIEEAGIQVDQVGYINAHGTSTQLNEKSETTAIKQAFGAHAHQLAVSSTKSMTGHLLGAAGAIEAIFTLKALEEGFLPATIHYQVPDPDCDLDVIPNEGRKAQVEYALSNSLGFGGHNACLLFRKAGK